jgi:hypothetical protein
MAKALPLPDGTTVAIREGETAAQTWERAQRMYPEAFGLEKEAAKPKQDTSGFKAAASAGATRLGGEFELLKGKLGVKSEAEAQKEYEAAQKRAQERFTPTEKGFTEDPLLKFRELLGGSLPSMALPAAAGLVALAAPVSVPVAAGLGLLGAGAVSTGQFTGSNLARQVDTDKSLQEASLGKAFSAAVPQALIDTAAMALLPGVGKLFGSVGSKLTTEQAKAIASQTLSKAAMDYTAKTGMAMGREGFTEVAQQSLERLQAGLNIADPEARKEYVESFIGGAVLGGTLAPVGRAFERSGAKTQAAKAERDERNLLSKEAAEQERVVQEQEEARRQTPVYALEKAKELQALEQEKIALQQQERKVTKNSPTEAEDKAFNKVIQEQLRVNKLARDEIAPEVNRLKQTGVYQQALEQERVAGMSPEDYMLEQMSQQTGIQSAGRKTNKGQLFPTEEPAPADTTLQDYAAEQLTAAQNVGALTTKDRLDYLMQNPEMAKQLLANRTPLPGVDEKEQKTIYSALVGQLKAYDKQQAEQERQKAAQLERVRGQMAGTTPGSELMATATQMPAVQAAEQQRAVDEARLRVVTPEVEGLQRLGQTPDYSPAQALRQSYETRKASEQQDEDLVQGLLDTLPKGGMITPGQVFQGLGGGTARERSDLLTQLAVAREASGKSKTGGIKDNDVSRGIIEKLRALKQTETTGTGAETAPMQTVLAGISVPEARAKEAAANKFADRQNQQLLAFTRMLGKVNRGTLVLPDTFKQRSDAAKQAYLELHIDEINARRDAFGLPPMADWERGEARARVMEALNELGDRWGSAANAGPAGQRQFGSQLQAVAALQEQMRTNIQKTVAGAAQRANLNATSDVADKTTAPAGTGPRIAAPAELTLRGEARTEPSTEDMIEALLSQTETRERAVPTEAVKPAKKVTDLGDIKQLLEKERSGGKLEPMGKGSVQLLQQLQDMLPQTTDADFKELARKIVRQIYTGNEPNLFDVRDLDEMTRGMEAAGQSETRPGVTPEELQRTSAQPQLDLFADKDTQTQRATPRNFQKMLDSGNVQRLRQAIAQLNKDSENEVAAVEETLTEAQEQLAKAEKITKKALDKIEALAESADVGSSPLADQSSEALATVKATDEKLKTRSRVAPETSKFVAEYGLKPTNKADDEIKVAWAEATRDVVAAESALQALPLRIAYLTEIRNSVAKLSKKGKQDLVALIDEALRFGRDPSNPASMRDSLEQKEFAELKQWLDPDTANTEIKRLKTTYNLAKRALGPARERVDAAVAEYEEGSTVRKALEREQKKAQDALAKAQRAEQAARAAVKEEQKQETTATEEVGTPNAEYRAALQRAREGLNLPGIRNLVDTTAMKQTIFNLRSAMGSFDAQLENKNLTEEKRAEIEAKREDAARKLASVYQDAPRITSEIKENGQLELERAFDDAQVKAYDKQAAKRRTRAGESPPVLPSSKTGPVVKGVRNQRISQSGETSETEATKEAATALEKLAEERATLADLERREKFLRDTGKAKSGGRLTPAFKALQDQITKQKNVVAEAAEEQNKIVAEVRETKQALGKKRIQNVASETEVGLKGEEASIPKPPKVVFRTVTRGPTSLQTAQVERLAERITKDWVNAPTIVVVATEADLPVRIRGQIVREGRKTGTTPGLFDTQTKKVYLIADNLSNANDVILTIAHEAAGHYGLRELLGSSYTATMDSLYGGNLKVRLRANVKIKENKKLSKQTAVEEVLAEMAEDPNPTPAEKSALRQLYERLRAWFRTTFNLGNVTDAEVQQIVANARRYVIEGGVAGEGQAPVGETTYRTKAVTEPDDALISLSKKIIAQPKTLKEKLGNNLALQTEMQAVDMRAGLRETLKFGDDKLFTQAMYHVRKAEQKMAQMFTVMNSGPLVAYKDEKGFVGYRSSNENSARDVFDAIADIPVDDPQLKTNIAQTYLVAVRANNKGLPKLDLGALDLKQSDLDAALAAADADPALKNALENVRRKYSAYNKGMIEFLASTGRISKKEAADLLKDGDYVPFYRIDKNGNADLVFNNSVTFNVGDIRRQPYLAELKGGDTKLLPLNEAIQRNTLLLTDMALTNNAAKSVAYGMQALGKGKGPVNPKTGKPTDLMAIKPGFGPDDAKVIRFYQEPDPNKPDDDGKRHIVVDTEGTLAEGIPAELVVQSLEGASLALPGFFKLGGAAADLLRAGVTRTPLYIARKLVREPMAAAFTGGLNSNAFSAVFKAGAEYLRMSTGSSDMQAKLIEKGLIQSNIFAGDMSDMKKMALQIASGKDQSALDKVFAAADRYAMRADAATLALVLKNAEENGLSEVEADMMTMESMNFYKRGLSPTLQYAARLIPFFNAQIQGLNVLVKAARGNMPFEEQQQIKRKFFNNAILLMGTGLVYAMAMDDDETFRNARPRDKYSNFFMPIPGVDEPLKLPIPFEAGYFFSLAVAAVDGMRAETDGKAQFQALKDLFLGSVPGYSSMGVPQIVKPAFEVWSNKNFLTGGNVESLRLQGLDPEARYLATTTELAKQMSKAIPILSPIQIEHLVRGYLGVLPLVAAAGANSLFERESKGEKPAGRASDLPLVGTAFQKKYGGADSDVVFREAKESEQARNTFNDMLKSGRKEEAIEYRDTHRVELAMAPAAGQYRQVIGRINADIRRTQERNDLTPEEKRLRLDALDKAKQDRAEAFIKQTRRVEERLGG